MYIIIAHLCSFHFYPTVKLLLQLLVSLDHTVFLKENKMWTEVFVECVQLLHLRAMDTCRHFAGWQYQGLFYAREVECVVVTPEA